MWWHLVKFELETKHREMSDLPRDRATGPSEYLRPHPEHDLPVAWVDVGSLVAGQDRTTVDVSLAVQQGEPAPVLHVENGSHLAGGEYFSSLKGSHSVKFSFTNNNRCCYTNYWKIPTLNFKFKQCRSLRSVASLPLPLPLPHLVFGCPAEPQLVERSPI